MAVTYGFYNALEHDRLYDAIQMSSIFDGIIQDGIFSTIGTSMIVTAPEDGMYVDVGPGRAWFNHTWTYNDTIYPIEAEEAEVVLDRIDAVVLEVNSAADVRANRIYFIKGTPSSNPVKPTMVHNPEVNQYALAYVHIRAGQTTIFQQDIENVVGTDETPFVTGLLQQVSVERLLLQWDDEFHRYFANFKRVSEADLLTWFNARKDEYDAWYADMEREGAEDLETFDAWFQHMKDQLDEDAAGHLQAEIDELAEACEKGSVLTVTTDEPDLIGRTCTVSQGLNSINKQFDSNGVAEFPSVPYIGNDIDIRATYGDNIAQTVITIPYFGRYGADIAFWAATLDIRSTVDTLYGRTITISKGGSVVGTTTFDNTGHAVYKVHETGTYHVSTSTAGGDVYEEDVVVTEETLYSIELGLPNGSTALPVNDIQIWLKCAGITDKTYLQTLADVLGEPETFELLLSDSNACNYMARSTAWADIPLVPIAFDNKMPCGTLTATSQYSADYAAWKAFDTNRTTKWVTSAAGTSHSNLYLRCTFTEPKIVRAYYVRFDADTRSVSYKLQGSNDGSTWTDIGETSSLLEGRITVDNETAYISYRLFIISETTAGSSYSGGRVQTLQFYENATAGVAFYEDAMCLIDKYGCACDILLSNSAWSYALGNSEWFEKVLTTKVPVMTSNTAPSGEAGASSSNGARPPYQAFNGKTINVNDGTTFWLLGTPPGYVYYHFTQPINVVKAKVANQSGSSVTLQSKWMYSDDGVDWTDATQLEDFQTSTSRVIYTYDFPSCGAHEYWAFYISGQYSIGEVQFYGRPEASTGIIHSAPLDTVYYLDNGSPVTLCTTDANGIGSVDWNNLPIGDITLYSSVAKNPSDVTADYSKTIKVTKNKVEAYLMPIHTLYWWGYNVGLDDNFTGVTGSNISRKAYTSNTNNIYVSCSSSQFSTLGTGKMQTASKVHAIGYGTQGSNYNCRIAYASSKTANLSSGVGFSDTTWTDGHKLPSTLGHLVINEEISGDYYIVWLPVRCESTLNALWLE